MRIGFDATPLLGQRVGIGNYTAYLLSALLQQQPADDYYLYSNRPLGHLEPPLDQATQMPGYFERSRWLWMQWMLPTLLKRTQLDLCHYTNASAPLHQTRPFVLTIHDASLFVHREHHPVSRLVAIRALLPLLARRAAAVITVSQHARAELLRALDVPTDKIHVIYEAPPPHFVPAHDKKYLTAVKEKFALPDKYILYLGTLEPRKNLTRLVQATSQLHHYGCQIPLLLVGPKGWHMNGFKEEISRLGAEPMVRYLGYVPSEALPAIYSLATVFAFPSLYEGFGLPPLEAMACGTPVLTSQASAMAEVGGDAVHLIDPYSVESITEGLHNLLTNAPLREELSQLGQKHAQQFSWERAAQETTAVYRQVLQTQA